MKRATALVILLLLVGVVLTLRFTRQASEVTRPSARPRSPVRIGSITAAPTQIPPPVTPLPVTSRPELKLPARNVIASAWRTETQPEMMAFTAWVDRYLTANDADRANLLNSGLDLARQRRAVLAQFIHDDPERALADAVPMVVRQDLPAPVLALLEERVADSANLSMLGVTPAPGQIVAEPVFRSASINGQNYRAFTYGRRGALATLPNASLVGIAVDNALAVSDSPVRVLEPGELAAGRPVNSVCVISGKTTPADSKGPFNLTGKNVVEAGGQIHVLCHVSHVVEYEHQLIAKEQANYAPVLPEVDAADGGQGSSTVAGRPSSTWSHGTKKLLIIRVDFSDKVGVPLNPTDNQFITPAYVAARINNVGGVNDYYNQNSFGQAGLSLAGLISGNSADVTPVLRMPQTAASYAVSYNNDGLHSDAEALATSAGYNLNSYDRIGVVFSDLSNITNSQINYGGLGEIIGKNFWINGFFDFDIVAHELGHTFGLNHSNLWAVTDNNPVSPNGASVEYGDIYAIMGNGTLFTHEFSQWNKSILQWIPDTAITTITTSGTYRVFQFDISTANLTNTLGLKIVRNNDEDYWIGYRGATNISNLNGGAYILWGYNTNRQGNLLNLTSPGSTATNPALPNSLTFNDTASGIAIKTVDFGGSGASRFLDIQVTFQPRLQWDQPAYYVDKLGGNLVLNVTRSNNSSGAVSVHYATSNGTAASPTDYTAASGNVSWANGDAVAKTVTIPLTSTLLAQDTGTFNVTLSSPSGGVLPSGNTSTIILCNPGIADPQFEPFYINDSINRVLVQPDGSVLAAGDFNLVEDTAFVEFTRGGIVRYTSDGVFDPTFGVGNGVAGGNASVKCLARQPDGKILIGGDFTTVNGAASVNLARLNADGSLDSSFNAGTGPDNPVYALLVQPDGKFLIGGTFTHVNGAAHEYLARFNADGSLDSTFTGPDFGGTSGWDVESLALQSDGKILAGGDFFFPGATFKASICRLNSNGSLDATFNGVVQGAHFVGSPSSVGTVNDIAPLPDGTLLIVGDFTAYNNVARGGLARLTTNGSLDTTFAPAGASFGNFTATCYRILVQPDGKLLVGGAFSSFNNTTVSNLVRLSANGAIDTTFAAAEGPDFYIHDFALQPDNRIIFGADWSDFQTLEGPMLRFFSGISGTPGDIQWGLANTTTVAGLNATLSATRTGGSKGAVSVFYSVDSTSGNTVGTAISSGVITWADGDSAAKTISLPVTFGANGNFTVNLSPGPGGAGLLGSNQQVTVTATGPKFSGWEGANFSTAELANPLISGATASAVGDGVSNIVKYAFGMNVHSFSRSNLPTVQQQIISGSQYVTITFRRRNPAGDLTYTPQTAASPAGPWTANAVQVGSAVSNGDGTETVTYRDSTPVSLAAPLRVMRVQVVVGP